MKKYFNGKEIMIRQIPSHIASAIIEGLECSRTNLSNSKVGHMT